MKATLALAASLSLFGLFAANAVVAQQPTQTDDGITALIGHWSGTIVVDRNLSQDVLWRFERAASGELIGFMGPAAAGAATIPMQNIASDGADLSFTVDSQSGEFFGTLSQGEATGTWRQGQSGAVILTRTAVDADASGGPYSVVLGRWEGRQAGNPDGPPMSYFRFGLGDSGALFGLAGDSPEDIMTSLENVALEESSLTFQAPAQAPAIRRFTGDVSGDEASGAFFQGVEASISMRRTD